jgi:hypothetical protein
MEPQEFDSEGDWLVLAALNRKMVDRSGDRNLTHHGTAKQLTALKTGSY